MSYGKKVRYKRKLSGIERYSMAINEVYRYNVDGLAVGSGEITLDELRNAVKTAAQANPGMRVRLKSILGFTKWVDSEIPPPVSEVNVPQWDAWSERGADFLQKERFDPLHGGPIADVVLARLANHRSAVVFRNLHAAVDGRGVLHWMQEVFRALRGDELLGGESTLVDYEVGEKFRDKFPPEPTRSEKKKAEKENAPPVYMPVVAPSTLQGEPLRYFWRTVSIPKRITTILPRAAVFLGAYARRQGDGVVGFTVPVDYRGLRVDANSTGNLTGYLRIHVSAEDTPKTVMQQLNQQLREFVDCRLPIMAKPLRWIPMRLIVNKLNKNLDEVLYTPNKDLPTGGLVSMGHCKFEDYSTPRFSCEHALGIPGSVGKLNVVAVNYSESTCVTFSAPDQYNRDGQIDRMIDEFVADFSS